MKALNSIILINSASINYTNISLDGNTLLSGANGAGKTTLLRAVLFFYHANSRKVDINSLKKKSFKEYYFSSLNSYIIYKYKNSFSDCYVMMYKTSLGLDIKYRFFSSYTPLDIEDIFFEDSLALESSTIIGKLRKLGCDISNTITSAKEYRDILYNHNKEYRQFALFNTKQNYDQIYNTISNIFINSKLESNVIKKSLVNSIEDFIPIDLNYIRKDLKGFLNEFNDIKNFEKNKEFSKKSLKELSSIESNQNILKELSQEIYSQYLFSKDSLCDIEKDYSKNIKELLKNKEEKKKKKDSFEKKYKQIEKKHTQTEFLIDETKRKQKEYDEKNINEKLKLYGQKDSYLQKEDSLKKQIELLKSDARSEAMRFDELIKEQDTLFGSFKNEKEKEINTIGSEFVKRYKNLAIKKEKQLKEIDNAFKQKLELQTKKVEDSKDSLKDEQNRKKIEKNRVFYKEKIEELSHKYQEDTKKQSTLNLEIEKLRRSISDCDSKIKFDEVETRNKIEQKANLFQSKKNTLNQKIQKYQKNLKIPEDTFLGYLKLNDFNNTKYMQSILNEEILFHKNLNPKIEKEDDTIFGVSIDKNKIDVDVYDDEYIEQRIEELEKEIKDLEDSFKKEKIAIESLNEKNTKNIYKKKKALNNSLETKRVESEQLNTTLIKTQSSLVQLRKKSDKEKKDFLEKIDKNIEKLKEEFEAKERILRELEKQKESEKRSIKSNITKQENSLNDEELNLTENLRQSIEQYEKNIIKTKKEILKDKEQKLLEKGIDTKALDKKEKELDFVSLVLKEIKDMDELIFSYKKDKKELFDNLSLKIEELKTYTKQLSELKNFYEEETNVLNKNIEDKEKELEKLKEEGDSFTYNITQFEKFTNTPVYEYIKVYFQEQKTLKYESIDDIKDKIYGVKDTIESTFKTLGRSLNSLFRNISSDNILNLSAPKSSNDEDILECAKALKEFENKNMLEFFKKGLSSRYSQSLAHYEKEIKTLLEAQGTIDKTIKKITKKLSNLKNIKVIEKVELRYADTQDKAVQLLSELKTLYENNSFKAEVNLFNPIGADDEFNQKVIELFEKLHSYLYEHTKKEFITLEDSFVLEFRAIENGNDTGFVQILDDVGSNGTDVMVKVMVYISMLNLAYEQSLSKNTKEDEELYFHCILDEVGILSPKYLKELIRYANANNIRFLNGAPDEKIVTTYKRVYILRTTDEHKTIVNEIISKV